MDTQRLHLRRLIDHDPDGNNIEAVFHGEVARSAESIVVASEG